MDSLKTFCELPSIDDERDYLTWHRDPRLARYLRGLEDRSLVQIADVLVTRICSTPPDKLACACVTALLAHILFSASGRARIRSQIFNPLQHHSTQIELEDIYQIALDIISQPAQFLANFQPDETNWYGSLIRYSNYRFDRLLIDRIRSLPEMSGFKRTNLGLIARSSPRRMTTALTRQGDRDLRLQQLLLLHQCLVEVIAAGKFDTRNPQLVHYDNLSARYIEQCERVDLAIDDLATLIQLVEYMGTAIRNYLQPQLDTLNRSIGNNDAEGAALIDLIPDLIEHHQILESRILKQDIVELSNKLAIDSDRLLMFFYGLELTQLEVGIELDCNQTTAKRRHDRCLKQLARDLHANTFQTEHLSSELLDSIVDRLKIIYEDIYAELLLAIFDLIIADPNSIASNIVDLFVDRIEQQWQFKFKPAQMGLTKSTAFVRLRSPQVS
jgi:DNA-directed RNA polymerase specialized sigma24 family protein